MEDSDAHKNEVLLSTSQFHLICPNCGQRESVEEIEAKIDGSLRNRALTLSAVAALFMLIVHCLFAWYGKVLPIPDILWAVVLGPWLGAGTEKVIHAVNKAVSKGAPGE